jgi:hypothetical protein
MIYGRQILGKLLEIHTANQLNQFFDSEFSISGRRPLHIISCFSKIKPIQLPGVAQLAERTASVDQVGENLFQIKLFLKKRGANGWLVTKGEIWRFYVDSMTSPVEAGNILESWISGLFPTLVFARVESSQLLDLMDALNEIPDAKLGLQDYLLKSFPGGFSSKSWVAGQPYKRTDLERITAVEKKVLHAIHFEMYSKDLSFEARISRLGHLVYYRGSKRGFDSFYRLIMDTMITGALKHRERLSEKEKRIVNDEVKLSPIAYEIGRKGLSPKPDFEKFETAFSTGSGYYMSLLSEGNPWMYLHVIDRGDGSVYDLYVFERRLELVPLEKATPESLAKINALIEEVVPEARPKLN